MSYIPGVSKPSSTRAPVKKKGKEKLVYLINDYL